MVNNLTVKLLTRNVGFFNTIKHAISNPNCKYAEGVTFMPANKKLRKRLKQYIKPEWSFVEIVKTSPEEQYIAIKGKNIEQLKIILEQANRVRYY